MNRRPIGNDHEKKGASRFGALSGLIALLVLGSFFFLAVFFSLPSNVVATKDSSGPRVFFSKFMPEVWGFFTKPPDSPEFAVFSVTDGEVKNELAFPHTRRQNLYGISRKHRAQGPEIALLANQTEESKWVNCRDVPGDCVLSAQEREATPIHNDFQARSLCGSIVLVETTPIEWSYRKDFDGWRQENKAIHIESIC